MRIDEIYNYTLNVINKDVQGLAFGPDQFNNLIKFENLELFRDSFTKAKAAAAQKQDRLSVVLFESQDLRNFIVTEILSLASASHGTLSIGSATFPADMEYPITIWSGGKDVEIASPYMLGRIRGSVINRDFSERPVAVAVDGAFEFYPNDLTELVLTYLKTPSTPYYDYCLDSNDVSVFMPAGSYIKYDLVPAHYNLFSSTGTLLAQDVTHTYFANVAPNPVVTYTSLTADLEWADTMHLHIANRILEKMGVNLRSPEVVQYAQTK